MLEDQNPPTTAQALTALCSNLGLVLLCAVVVAASAFGFAQLREGRYTATATLHFAQQPPDAAQIDALASDSKAIPRTAATNAEVARRPPVLAATAAALGTGRGALEGELRFKEASDAGSVEMSATSSSAAGAAATANAYARRYVAFQNRRNVRLAKAGLAKLRGPGDEAIGSGADAKALRMIARGGYGEVSLAAAASPSLPSSPDLTRDVLIGFTIGLFLGAMLVLALESRAMAARMRRTPRIGGWDGRAADA